MRLRSLQHTHKKTHFKSPRRDLTMDDSLAGLFSEVDDVHALGVGPSTGTKAGTHAGRSLSVFDDSINKGVRVVRKLRQMSNIPPSTKQGGMTMGPSPDKEIPFTKAPKSI